MKKLLLFLFPLLCIVGCGTCDTSLKDKFNMANELARTGSHESMPLFRTWCDEEIDKCKKAGITAEKKDTCTAYVTCSKLRRGVVTSANAVHIGVKMGVFYLTIRDTKKASEMFSSVMKAIGEMKAALKEAGFLKPLGINPGKEVL